MGQSLKHLVTNGCSFSTVYNPEHDLIQGGTWPQVLKLLTNQNNWQHTSLAQEGQGNGIISRQTIKTVIELLDSGTDPGDMFVAVMWSGPNRIETYKNGSWNPAFVGSDEYNAYHKFLGHRIGDLIVSIEHILRLQWFLDIHCIPYFMTTYTGEVLPKMYASYKDVAYLYKQINFDNFLPIDGMYEWCRDHSTITFPIKGDKHPGFKQHREFTEKIILPFCYNKGLLKI